ncbi:MAG TPA: phosphoglycolate phosphatase [Casimicrobiaceae bacterium]|nr:phosphoglycolate phosphatase [Casimicrobiaceae bacterium]
MTRSREPARFVVDAIAFDLDGTLLDTIHDLAAAVNALLVESGMKALPPATIRNLVGKGMPHLLTRSIALARGTPPDETELARFHSRYQDIYGARLGEATQPFPELHDTLDHLVARGFRLAVITNKASKFVEPHLVAADIAQYFDVVVGGDDASAKKPHAAPLLLAAAKLHVPPARMLMVGDSANDVDAARAAGCPVVVVPHGYSEGIPVQDLSSDGIVPTLFALTGVVERAQR